MQKADFYKLLDDIMEDFENLVTNRRGFLYSVLWSTLRDKLTVVPQAVPSRSAIPTTDSSYFFKASSVTVKTPSFVTEAIKTREVPRKVSSLIDRLASLKEEDQVTNVLPAVQKLLQAIPDEAAGAGELTILDTHSNHYLSEYAPDLSIVEAEITEVTSPVQVETIVEIKATSVLDDFPATDKGQAYKQGRIFLQLDPTRSHLYHLLVDVRAVSIIYTRPHHPREYWIGDWTMAYPFLYYMFVQLDDCNGRVTTASLSDIDWCSLRTDFVVGKYLSSGISSDVFTVRKANKSERVCGILKIAKEYGFKWLLTHEFNILRKLNIAGVPHIPFAAYCHRNGAKLLLSCPIGGIFLPSSRPFLLSIKIVNELVDAVHGMHCQGVVHRDLRPMNIVLLDPKEVAKLSYKAPAKSANQDPAYTLFSHPLFCSNPSSASSSLSSSSSSSPSSVMFPSTLLIDFGFSVDITVESSAVPYAGTVSFASPDILRVLANSPSEVEAAPNIKPAYKYDWHSLVRTLYIYMVPSEYIILVQLGKRNFDGILEFWESRLATAFWQQACALAEKCDANGLKQHFATILC